MSANYNASVSTAIGGYWLGKPTTGSIHAAFTHAVYVAMDDPGLPALVAIVTVDGVRQPGAAVLDVPSTSRPFAALQPGQIVVVGARKATVADITVTLARWWDPRAGKVASARHLACRLAAWELVAVGRGSITASLAAPLNGLVDALRQRSHGDALRAAHNLIGRGPGLTPSGDDMLAGFVATMLACTLMPEHPVAQVVAMLEQLEGQVMSIARQSTTAISAVLLQHAFHGEVTSELAAVLRSSERAPCDDETIRRLVAVGSTSGSALLYGMIVAARLASSLEMAPDAMPTGEGVL